jgi:hypothetical protein
MTYTVQEGQSFWDCVLCMTGTLEAATSIAEANGISVTDEVTTGQELAWPTSFTADKAVLQIYNDLHITPGTATTPGA